MHCELFWFEEANPRVNPRKKEKEGRKKSNWQNEKKWRLGKLHTKQSFKMVFLRDQR